MKNTLLVPLLLCSLPCAAQKTSTWTGEGSDTNWTTTDNWDTPEDPNGGDTALVLEPFDLTLDANRSVGLLNLNGQIGNFVTVTGSSQLTVQNGMTLDEVIFNGAGTLVSTNNSVLSGVISLNNWTTTLGGTTTVGAGAVTTSATLNLNGTTNWSVGDLGGSGTVNLAGTLTKNHTANPAQQSFFDPVVLNQSGTMRAASGVIVVAPTQLSLSGNPEFATDANGRVRLLADDAIYENVTFNNAGQMDITDDVLATPGSIKFRGTAISSGSEPVDLGVNGRYDVSGATFTGPWRMRGAALEGGVEFGGGGFVWQSGDIGTATTNTGATAGDFVISPSGGTAVRVLGRFTNNGHVTQTGTFALAEGTSGSGTVPPVIDLADGSTWEIQGTAGITEGPSTGETPTLLGSSGGILQHTGTSGSDSAVISVRAIFQDAVARNTAGRLDFDGQDNSFTGASFSILDTAGLNSRIRLTGKSTLSGSVSFVDGGAFEFRESSPGTTLRSLVGTGPGEGRLGDGTVFVPPYSAGIQGTGPSLIDFGVGDPLSGEAGAVFRVFREGSGAETVAILFGRRSSGLQNVGLVVRGNFEWSGRVITTDAELGQVPDPLLVGTLVNQSEQFKILQASGQTPTLSDVKLENRGRVQFGAGGDPFLTIRRSPIRNVGVFEIEGNGDFSLSADAALSKFTNEPGGRLEKIAGTSTSNVPMDLSNLGTVEVRSGTLSLGGSISQYDDGTKTLAGGAWVARGGGILTLGDITEIAALAFPAAGPPPAPGFGKTTIVVDGAGSQILNKNGQPLFAQGGLLLSSNTVFSVEGGAAAEIGGDLDILGGVLGGDGTLMAPMVTVGEKGAVAPGKSPGTLSIQGGLEFQANSRYEWEASAAAHDVIAVTGPVTLGGYFEPNFLDGFVPAVGQSFTMLTATSITGSFDGQLLGCLDDGLRFTFQNTGTALIATVASASYADYASWAAEHFDADDLLDANISGRDADPEGDGIANLLEFLTGGSPVKMDPQPWAFSDFAAADGVNPAAVTVDFPWRDGVAAEEFFFEVSGDLVQWDPAGEQILSDVTADGFRALSVRLTGSNAAVGPRFFRLGARPSL